MSFTHAVAVQPDSDQTGHFGKAAGFQIYEITDRPRWLGQRPALLEHGITAYEFAGSAATAAVLVAQWHAAATGDQGSDRDRSA